MPRPWLADAPTISLCTSRAAASSFGTLPTQARIRTCMLLPSESPLPQ